MDDAGDALEKRVCAEAHIEEDDLEPGKPEDGEEANVGLESYSELSCRCGAGERE